MPAAVAAVAAVAAAAGAAVFPAGMPLAGTPQRLIWTPRLIRLAACCLLLEALVAGAAAGLGAPAALGALAVAVPAVADAGALIAAPLEALLARRYRRAARATLARVGPRVIAVTGPTARPPPRTTCGTCSAGSMRWWPARPAGTTRPAWPARSTST